MHLFRPVHAQGERRRRHADLGRRLQRERLAPHRDGPPLDRLLQRRRHLGGRDAAPRFRRHLVHDLEDLAQALAGGGRGETHRRVLQERQPLAQLVHHLGLAHHAGWNQVPLVDDQNHGSTGIVGIATDVGVLAGEALVHVGDRPPLLIADLLAGRAAFSGPRWTDDGVRSCVVRLPRPAPGEPPAPPSRKGRLSPSVAA